MHGSHASHKRLCRDGWGLDVPARVSHGESNTSQAPPRMTAQCMCQLRKQCSSNKTKLYSNPTPPRKRQKNPINGHTPRRTKPTHTRLTYTRMRPHAPSHQAGDHPVPAHTECRIVDGADATTIRTPSCTGVFDMVAVLWARFVGPGWASAACGILRWCAVTCVLTGVECWLCWSRDT